MINKMLKKKLNGKIEKAEEIKDGHKNEDEIEDILSDVKELRDNGEIKEALMELGRFKGVIDAEKLK